MFIRELCIVILYLQSSCHPLPHFYRGRMRGGNLGVPILKEKVTLPTDKWFLQNLDHFDSSNTQTWEQRYFVNDTFYKPGGPVFVQIGGEGEANPIWMVTGAWIKYAQSFNAMCFQLEHRFYGKSHPTMDMSTESLIYLSSEQALADLAHFIETTAVKMNLTNAKWITFGGSYPGSLSAWFRLKYPHIVHAAVATSAPILAVADFKDYLGVVRDSLATTGPLCNKVINEAVLNIEDEMTSEKGRHTIKDMFQLCDDIDVSSKEDIANLYSLLAGNFEGVVQYNKDNRAFEGAVGTNITIDTLCDIMTDDKSKLNAIERYAAVNMLILKTYKEKCQDFKYSNMIKELQQTNWSSSAAEGGRQWTYQTCTEFGFYQSSNLQNQPFGHEFPLRFWVQQCTDIFGEKFNEDLLNAGINRTNENYGGYGIKVSRVVFPNGSIDPWHALGVTKDISEDAAAIYINGTAHCANMYPDTPSDLPQLTSARLLISKKISQWLQED